MTVTLRAPRPDDAAACGRICFEAFHAVAGAHGFPADFPSAAFAAGVMEMLIGHPRVYGVVAERDGAVVGSNFMDERAIVSAIGPITVDPAVQNGGVGRALMTDVLNRAATRGAAGVRLVQAGYHNRSLCLYTTLGFQAREPLSVMQGPALKRGFDGYTVRPAQLSDVAACEALCRDVHGFDRGGDLREAIEHQDARVVEHLGRITGYASGLAFFGHAVGRTNQDIMALIAAAEAFEGPGFLLPTRNHELFAWCLANGLRLVQQMTLMTIGLYNEPCGAYLPSILF